MGNICKVHQLGVREHTRLHKWQDCIYDKSPNNLLNEVVEFDGECGRVVYWTDTNTYLVHFDNDKLNTHKYDMLPKTAKRYFHRDKLKVIK